MKYLILLSLLFFCGCTEDPITKETLSDNDVKIPTTTVKIESGQDLTIVDYYEFQKWLDKNKSIFIYSISPIDRTGHGRTSAFIIVYRKLNENERSERQKALEKLTDADKKALGIE